MKTSMYKTIQISLVLILNLVFSYSSVYNFTHPLFSNFNIFSKFTHSDEETGEYHFLELVRKHNYSAEEYIVHSEDGYKLCLHRISGSPSHPKAPGKKVVYFQHGWAMWSVNFVLKGPGQDLVFLLSDAGYDIWLGNVRGSPYSRSHVSKSPENTDFWDFSYHEVALNDVPVFIDHALNISKQEKLIYIGYSLGTTMSLVLFSLLPEYNKKVDLVIELAPVSFWKHTILPLYSISHLLNTVEIFNKFISLHEIFGRQNNLFGYCNLKYAHERIMCSRFLAFYSLTLDHNQIDESTFALFTKTYPVGTSAKTLFHLAQNIKSGEFQAYDYGRRENKRRYGSNEAPKYPLHKIIAPVALFYGPKDKLTVEKDIKSLEKALPNVIVCKKIPHEEFGHLEMVLANDAKSLVFKDILSLASRYT